MNKATKYAILIKLKETELTHKRLCTIIPPVSYKERKKLLIKSHQRNNKRTFNQELHLIWKVENP